MGTLCDLSLKERKEIIHLHSKRFSATKIASIVGCHRRTVGKILQRYRETGSYYSLRHHCGRNTKLVDRDIRRLKRIIVSNRRSSLDEIVANFDRAVCKNTMRTALHHLGYFGRCTVAKPLASKKNRI